MKKGIFLVALLVAVMVSANGSGRSSDTQTCASMNAARDSERDATPIFADCLKNLSGQGVLQLLPGTYQLRTPLIIDRAVRIETKHGQACSKETGAHCAILALGGMQPQRVAGTMPIEVAADSVHLHSIVITGAVSNDQAWQNRTCLTEKIRPLGGGVRVKANGFRMTAVLIKNVSCYTAVEVIKGAKKPAFSGNVIGPNGTHNVKLMWSDGITIHDTDGAIVEDNVFIDNSDVQLILGGCKNCLIRNNKFYHSDNLNHAAFGELMVHAWPDTSGDFTNSNISGNSIDCGRYRRCGYGIMIGGEPWYPSKAFGGAVRDNRIKNALMGLNIDKLTGPMDIGNNIVTSSGGKSRSDCGVKVWPAINISPESMIFAMNKPKFHGLLNTRSCLLGK